MNYQKAYADVPTPTMMGSVVTLTVVEASSYSPPRAVLRTSSGPYVSLEPSDMRRLSKDLAEAADDVDGMRDELEALAKLTASLEDEDDDPENRGVGRGGA